MALILELQVVRTACSSFAIQDCLKSESDFSSFAACSTNERERERERQPAVVWLFKTGLGLRAPRSGESSEYEFQTLY